MASSAILRTISPYSSFKASFFSQRLATTYPQQHIQKISKKFAIRAARTESKGVSLGFRPPQFQVFFIFIQYVGVIQVQKIYTIICTFDSIVLLRFILMQIVLFVKLS